MEKVNDLSELRSCEYNDQNDLEININNRIFNCEVSISENVLSSSFENCVFNEKVTLSSCIFLGACYFINCEFKAEVVLKDVTFNEKAVFWDSQFMSVNTFDNVRFNKLADFYQTTFAEPLILYKVDFNGVAVFSKAQFAKPILFTYTKIKDFLLFVNTTFNEGIDLSLAMISGNIIYSNSSIKSFNSVEVNGDSKYNEAVEKKGNVPIQNKLETYRILKKYAKFHENYIQYLEFSKCEIETYSKILKNKNGNYLDSKIIFMLNNWSNRHNTSWTQAVIFTILVGLFFYFFAFIFSQNSCFSVDEDCKIEIMEVIKGFFIFLVPTHKVGEIFSNNESNAFVFFFDLLGRIFISYGIYQTIQAFRKYK